MRIFTVLLFELLVFVFSTLLYIWMAPQGPAFRPWSIGRWLEGHNPNPIGWTSDGLCLTERYRSCAHGLQSLVRRTSLALGFSRKRAESFDRALGTIGLLGEADAAAMVLHQM